MYYDYQYGNKNAKNFPDGYYGKFIIREGSNPYFYKKTENYILEVIADEIK
jgi:hypothetical protein